MSTDSRWTRFKCFVNWHEPMWTTPELLGRLIAPGVGEFRRRLDMYRLVCLYCGRFCRGAYLYWPTYQTAQQIRDDIAEWSRPDTSRKRREAWEKERIAVLEARLKEESP